MKYCALLVACLLAAGCLSSEKAPAAEFYRPVPPAPAATAPIAADAPRRPVRVREVEGAAHLREPIAWSSSDARVGFHDARLWTQPPANYVEEALSRHLFERRALRRSASGSAPVLSVRVTAFEERLLDAGREAFVELRFVLLDGKGDALVEREVRARRPVSGEGLEVMAKEMGAALDAAVTEVATAVEAALPPLPAK